VLFGIIVILGSLLLGWLASGILGGIGVIIGIGMIGLQLVKNSEPEIERPTYENGSRTYNLSSKGTKRR
jgi:hypothetical protein